MNRDQANELHKHLMEANAAVNRASGVAINLDTPDRKIFAALLRGFYSECDDILESIYARYPDLRPLAQSQVIPEISSPLRWADVALPASVTAADLDKIIFSMLRPRLMKTARIIGDVVVECKRLSWPITPEIVGARIEELSDEERIDSEGDLRYWGHSEIRLTSDDSD
jgi:uncharacterized protein DUF3658